MGCDATHGCGESAKRRRRVKGPANNPRWPGNLGLGLWVVAAVLVGVTTWPRQDWLLLRNRFINSQAVERLGYGGYFLYDLVDTSTRLWRRSRLDHVDPAPYRAYLAERAATRPEPDPTCPRKHVIYLQLESMDGLMIGGRKAGQPVMPFLESLAHDNVWFANAIDNTASGRTTDGEFLVLTSTVPLPRPPVYVTQHLDRIASLPRVLGAAGYHTMSLHGFNRVFWHRGEAHAALGYDEMVFEDDLDLGDEIGWGWSDKAILGEAARRVIAADAAGTPLFLHVITLTNHHPYTYVAKSQGVQPGRIEAEFLRSARYVDDALKQFFGELSAAGVLDDCLIAIYGDHDSAIDDELMVYLDHYEPRALDDTVPLVMVGFDRPAQRVNGMAGLQDVPVMMLEELGLPVPFTFTGNGWGQWGRTVGAQHGAVENAADGTWQAWESGVNQDTLTRLVINHSEKLHE